MGFEIESGRVEDLDTPDAHITLIRSQWSDFAAFAWQKYLDKGRGAVIIDLTRASTEGQKLQVPTYYVADSSEELSKRGGWPTDEIARVIGDYEPEQDVVLIFIRLTGEFFHYNASDELTPPAAYQKLIEKDKGRSERPSSNQSTISG